MFIVVSILLWGIYKKKCELSFASFDSLRFWTTLSIQIYAQKTHAITQVCINLCLNR